MSVFTFQFYILCCDKSLRESLVRFRHNNIMVRVRKGSGSGFGDTKTVEKSSPRLVKKKPSGFTLLLFHHPSSSFYESQLIDM